MKVLILVLKEKGGPATKSNSLTKICRLNPCSKGERRAFLYSIYLGYYLSLNPCSKGERRTTSLTHPSASPGSLNPCSKGERRTKIMAKMQKIVMGLNPCSKGERRTIQRNRGAGQGGRVLILVLKEKGGPN